MGWVVGAALFLVAAGLGSWWFGDARPGRAAAPVEVQGPARPSAAGLQAFERSTAGRDRATQASARAAVESRSDGSAAPPRAEGPWTLQFVDAWGDPLDFLVVSSLQVQTDAESRSTQVHMRHMTDAEGRLQLWRGAEVWGTVLRLEPDVLGLETSIVVDLLDEALQDSSLVLDVPVGYWRVGLLGGDGEPTGGRASFSLAAFSADTAPPLDASGLFGGGQPDRKLRVQDPMLGGRVEDPVRARFDVRAGEELRVATALFGQSLWATGASGEVELSAPRAGPQNAPGVLELPVLASGVLLRGRVSERFANSDLLVVDLVGEAGITSQGMVGVDAEGAFAISLSPPEMGALRALHFTGRQARAGQPFGGTLELRPALDMPGVHDLGLVMLEELPVLTSGWLTWANGTPRASIRVEVWDEAPEALKGATNAEGGEIADDQVGLGRSYGRAQFQAGMAIKHQGLEARLQRGSAYPVVVDQPDIEGWFTVWGRWPRAQAVLEIGVIERIPITVGQTGVQFRAER